MSTRKALLILVLVVVTIGSLAGPALAAGPGMPARIKGVTVLTDPGPWFGKTYGEWSASWWQWIAQYGADPNPATATSDVNCRLGQRGVVWFLAGSTGGAPVARSCTIPSGKALLIPVLNAAWSDAEADLNGLPGDTYENLMGFIDENYMPYIDPALMVAKIDGQSVPISLVSWPPAGTSLPAITWAADNPFGVPAGPTVFVAKGYYILVRLSPGVHTVHTFATFGPGVLDFDVTLTLTVK